MEYRHLNDVDGSIKTKDVKTWLQNKDAYTLHKSVRLKFRRRRTFIVGIGDLWHADLADVSFYYQSITIKINIY